MIYLITALDAEARPLIEHYRLKRCYDLPYTVYRNDSTLLLVTQMGSKNAMMAVSALLGWCQPKESDCVINIGICGAPEEFSIGEALLIHQIIDQNRSYYPDILYSHFLRESSLMCLNTPQDIRLNTPVDMESSGIFQAASRFFKLHQMAYLKIVSDHFQPETLTKEGAMTLIQNHIGTIDSLISQLNSVHGTPPLFTSEERIQIECLKTHFTKSQGDAIEDALAYYRLKSPGKPLHLEYGPIPGSKRERNILHERIIAALTA